MYDYKGQVRVDLFQLVKQDYKFSSYKMDFISNKLINGEILKIDFQNQFIETNSIIGIE